MMIPDPLVDVFKGAVVQAFLRLVDKAEAERSVLFLLYVRLHKPDPVSGIGAGGGCFIHMLSACVHLQHIIRSVRIRIFRFRLPYQHHIGKPILGNNILVLSAPYIGPPSEAAVAAVVICTHQHRPGGGKAALGEAQRRAVLAQLRAAQLRRRLGAVGEVDGVERAARRVLQRLVQRHRHAHVTAQLMIHRPVRPGQANIKEPPPGQAG